MKLSLTFLILILSAQAWGRIEYALQYHVTSCTACHVSPFGGGPRNVNGKLFASRLDEPSEWSYQDRFSFDGRALAYYPKGGPTTRQGTALMTASAGINLPIKKKSDGSEYRLVGVYSLGVVLQGPREIYGLWQSKAAAELPVYVQVGRFNAPFGLMTDEHRTYTKILSRTEIFDYEMGFAISGDTSKGLHYDFAATNGLESGGQFNSGSANAPSTTSAAFLNARFMPASVPMLLGTSFALHSRGSGYKDPYALSVYTALSLDRMSGNKISGSVMAEAVYAEYWNDSSINPNINRYFIPATDTAYADAVKNRPAMAYFGQVNINIAKRWVAQYKYDRLTFDPRYSGDQYYRHGFGFKYYADANVILMTRYELARAGRPEISGTRSVIADQDAFWLMLELTL